jgi:Family of unknown function (DUF6166)
MIKINIRGELKNRKVWVDGRPLRPERSQRIWNHSPDGFGWGYEGSGPAQLALAILLSLTDERTAVQNHQEFKRKVIAGLPLDGDFDFDIDVSPFLSLKSA